MVLPPPPQLQLTRRPGFSEARGHMAHMLQIYFPRKTMERSKSPVVGETEAGPLGRAKAQEETAPLAEGSAGPDVHAQTNSHAAPVTGPPPASPAMNCSYSMTGMFLLRLGRSKKSDQGIRTWRMSGLFQW